MRIENKLHYYSEDKDDKKNKGMQEILLSLRKTQPGSHLIVVYPSLQVLREIYANYIMEQLNDNEIVLLLPYYETVEDVKKVLSRFQVEKGEASIDDHIEQGTLLIIDGHEAFFNQKQSMVEFETEDVNGSNNGRGNIVSLLRIMQAQLNRLKKDGITILVDMGCFFANGGVDYLLKYEQSIPQMFKDTSLKQLCIYHQRDFENRFTDFVQAKLLDQHGRSVLMLDN